MTRLTNKSIARFVGSVLLLVPWAASPPLLAGPSVELTASSLSGGIYQYAFSVSNSGPAAISIVTITDAPLADPLIASTLVAPPGFLANYDPGVGLTFGLVDFIEGASPFQPGTTISGFGFQSMSSPVANFRTFEALSVEGEPFAGDVLQASNPNAVPDGGGPGLLAGLAFAAAVVARRKLVSSSTITIQPVV